MSRYLANLNDGIDLNAIGQQIISGAEKVASSTASGVIDAATQAAQSGINSVIGGGNDTPATPTTTTNVSYPPQQPAEKPTTTTPMTIMPLLVPAAAGIGVWLWQKSLLWAGISAATTYVAAKYIAKNRAQKGGK